MSGGDQHTTRLASSGDERIGIYDRPTIVSMLFRETDRAQRMNTDLCLLQFAVGGFNSADKRLNDNPWDAVLCRIMDLVSRQLRSYDVLGRVGYDEFLAILPGCDPENAAVLAERLRVNVFGKPFFFASEAVQLSACFGIASSEGRSPVVVLREAAQALQQARETVAGTIICYGSSLYRPDSLAFKSSNSENEKQTA